MHSLGIDVGGTSTKLALLAPDHPPITTRTAPYARPTRVQWLAALREALDPLPLNHLNRVGICAPGLYDPQSRSISRSINMPALVGVDLHDLARSLVPAPSHVVVTSDARAAAHDLFLAQSLSGRLFALSLGTGVGAAVLDDARPLLVSTNSPGHFGQIDVSIPEPDRPPPIGPDGGRGGLEGYIGLPALRARYPDQPEPVTSQLRPDSPPIQALVRALRIAHALYRPNHVRLLGGVGHALSPLSHDIHRQVADQLTGLAQPGWTFGVATSDFHAAQGAARLALSDS